MDSADARRRLDAASKKLKELPSGDPRLSEVLHEMRLASADLVAATQESHKSFKEKVTKKMGRLFTLFW